MFNIIVEVKNKKGSSKDTKIDDENILAPIKTIRQIYAMCKSYRCLDEYNGYCIGQMLVDDRSEYMYPKGVFKDRIIETKVKKGKFYDKNELEIDLVSYASEKYTFKLKFAEQNLFFKTKDILFNNRDKIVVIGGKWHSFDKYNVFYTDISSVKQIAVI